MSRKTPKAAQLRTLDANATFKFADHGVESDRLWRLVTRLLGLGLFCLRQPVTDIENPMKLTDLILDANVLVALDGSIPFPSARSRNLDQVRCLAS
jgi:hypothetical protein